MLSPMPQVTGQWTVYIINGRTSNPPNNNSSMKFGVGSACLDTPRGPDGGNGMQTPDPNAHDAFRNLDDVRRAPRIDKSTQRHVPNQSSETPIVDSKSDFTRAALRTADVHAPGRLKEVHQHTEDSESHSKPAKRHRYVPSRGVFKWEGAPKQHAASQLDATEFPSLNESATLSKYDRWGNTKRNENEKELSPPSLDTSLTKGQRQGDKSECTSAAVNFERTSPDRKLWKQSEVGEVSIRQGETGSDVSIANRPDTRIHNQASTGSVHCGGRRNCGTTDWALSTGTCWQRVWGEEQSPRAHTEADDTQMNGMQCVVEVDNATRTARSQWCNELDKFRYQRRRRMPQRVGRVTDYFISRFSLVKPIKYVNVDWQIYQLYASKLEQMKGSLDQMTLDDRWWMVQIGHSADDDTLLNRCCFTADASGRGNQTSAVNSMPLNSLATEKVIAMAAKTCRPAFVPNSVYWAYQNGESIV